MDERNRGTWSSVLGARLLRLFPILWEQPKGEDGAAVWPPLWTGEDIEIRQAVFDSTGWWPPHCRWLSQLGDCAWEAEAPK